MCLCSFTNTIVSYKQVRKQSSCGCIMQYLDYHMRAFPAEACPSGQWPLALSSLFIINAPCTLYIRDKINRNLEQTMNADLVRIRQLMNMTRGDEKHGSSTSSTIDVLWVLYDRILHYDPHNPTSEDRDRFVLSKGHGCVAYYAILADKGFFPPSMLPTFMKWNSILGTHPDRNQVPGVEASTGSLGHGFPMAVGQGMAPPLKHDPAPTCC